MYERAFGTDWETIDDLEEIVHRAYALGVSARLGADHPEELRRLGEQIETTYDRSLVTLAYQKGRNEASAASDPEAVWEAAVDRAVSIRPPDGSVDAAGEAQSEPEFKRERDATPEMLRRVAIDTLPDDSTGPLERPSFLGRRGPMDRREGTGDATEDESEADRDER